MEDQTEVGPPAGTADAAAAPATPESPAAPTEAMAAELLQWEDRHRRLAAEYDNFRKRVTRERAELEEKAQAAIVRRLLDVFDDLTRMLASDPATTSAEVLRGAMDAMEKKLWKELQAAGVERVEPTGERFDATVHEAVHLVPATAGQEPGTVAATFQPGYRLRAQLLRPARVQVVSEGTH